MKTKIARKGSGRTYGSTSFVEIPLQQLMDKFKDPNQRIRCGRKWAIAVGFENLVSLKSTEYDKLLAETPKVDIKVTDLDAPNVPKIGAMAASVNPTPHPVSSNVLVEKI